MRCSPICKPSWNHILLCLLLLVLYTASYPLSISAQQQIDRAIALCDSGIAHLERGDVETAYTYVSQAIEQARNSPVVLIGMGRVLLEMPQQTTHALEYLGRAVRFDPSNPTARYYKALAHVRLSAGDIGRANAQWALRELEALIALDPSHPDAYYLQGKIYQDTYEDF